MRWRWIHSITFGWCPQMPLRKWGLFLCLERGYAGISISSQSHSMDGDTQATEQAADTSETKTEGGQQTAEGTADTTAGETKAESEQAA